LQVYDGFAGQLLAICTFPTVFSGIGLDLLVYDVFEADWWLFAGLRQLLD
jgi:hypothetical protein